MTSRFNRLISVGKQSIPLALCLVLFANCGRKSPPPQQARTEAGQRSSSSVQSLVGTQDPTATPPPPPGTVVAQQDPAPVSKETVADDPSMAATYLADLQLTVDIYKQARKRNLDNLQTLVKDGFYPGIPTPPPGKRFDFDAAGQKVRLVNIH